MVGVPKSIGCDACRKQKKKCTVDDQQPPCHRCQRLGIECKGYGLQRFIFKHNTPTRESKSRSHSPPSASNVNVALQTKAANRLVLAPSTGTDALAASMVRCLDREFTDPRYHLTWIFGGFLYSVPMYLGISQSLDSAVGALVASYTHFRHGGGSTVDATSLNLYTKALGDLRLSLETTESACAPTTLCAIMIMMIVETLVGGVDALHHAGGAARVLKSRGLRPPQDELEHNILATLRGPVAFQAFHLDEGYFTDAEWDHIMDTSALGSGNVMNFFSGFSATARLFQRLRRALFYDDQVRVQELIYRAWGLREQIKKQNAQTLNQLYGSTRLPENLSVFHRVNHTRNCGLLLSTQIILNCMIASIETSQRDALVRENSTLGRAAYKLAMEVESDRPLGSLWVCLMLSLAYIGVESVEDKAALDQLLQHFVSDIQTDKELWGIEQAERLREYITFRNLTGDGLQGMGVQI